MARTFSIRTKILLGLGISGILFLTAGLYCAYRLQELEHTTQQVNSLYLPTLKALGQVEGEFNLSERELDAAWASGQARPYQNAFREVDGKLENISRDMQRQGADAASVATINSLRAALGQMVSLEPSLLKKETAVGTFAQLSRERADFLHSLRRFNREQEKQLYEAGFAVQEDLRHSAMVITAALVTSTLVAFLFLVWLSHSLQPLRALTRLAQQISQRGITDDLRFPVVAESKGERADEIGVFAAEFSRMAHTLRDQTMQLRKEKSALEEAHHEMAKKNLELRRAQSKLLHQEKLALVGQMAAQVAHEIRNPLNAFGLQLDALEQSVLTGDSQEARDVLSALRREVDRLGSITSSYLGRAKPAKWDAHLLAADDLIDDVLQLYGPALSAQGVRVTCSGDDLPLILGDQAQLRTVLGNLVKNAMEAFPPTQKDRLIQIITEYNAATRTVAISCKDNGPGLDAGLAVFSPFATTKAEGTGLGLAHSKQAVEAMGGEIVYHSTPGKGAVFTVKMPAGPTKPVDLGEVQVHG